MYVPHSISFTMKLGECTSTNSKDGQPHRNHMYPDCHPVYALCKLFIRLYPMGDLFFGDILFSVVLQHYVDSCGSMATSKNEMFSSEACHRGNSLVRKYSFLELIIYIICTYLIYPNQY